jgi:hypothetical protein
VDPVTLAQAGPVAILLAGIGLLYRAFIKGDLVPGSIYRAMEERAIKAETQQERNAETLRDVVAVVKASNELSGAPNVPR